MQPSELGGGNIGSRKFETVSLHAPQSNQPKRQTPNCSFHFLLHHPYITPIYTPIIYHNIPLYGSFHLIFHYPDNNPNTYTLTTEVSKLWIGDLSAGTHERPGFSLYTKCSIQFVECISLVFWSVSLVFWGRILSFLGYILLWDMVLYKKSMMLLGSTSYSSRVYGFNFWNRVEAPAGSMTAIHFSTVLYEL